MGNFLDPRDDPSKYPSGLTVLMLTALDNTFQSLSFLVEPSLTSTVLPVALDAIKTGYQVLADVDWPQPVLADQDGNPVFGPVFCHSLWLNQGVVDIANMLSQAQQAIQLVANIMNAQAQALQSIAKAIGS